MFSPGWKYAESSLLVGIIIMMSCNSEATSCPMSCTCQNAILRCVGVAYLPLPSEIPGDILQYEFEHCDFPADYTLPHLHYFSAKTLIFHNCSIYNFAKDAFVAMTQLAMLDLSNNAIREINQETFIGLEDHLITLVLRHNKLSNLADDTFKHVPNLQRLDLAYNGVDSPQQRLELGGKVFSPLTSLKYLYLDHCGLNSVPVSSLSSIHSTEFTNLDLNHNNIQEIHTSSFSKLPTLNYLNLDDCRIHTVHKNAFSSLHNLTTINLGFNNIQELDSHTFQPFKAVIKNIFIEHNQLRTLSEELLPGWEKIKELRIYGNLWHCECDLHWMRQLHPIIDDVNTYSTCSSPEEFAGQSLINVTLSMQCASSSGSSTVALAIFILFIICVDYYIYRIAQNRQDKRLHSYNYTAVYKDTVESTTRNNKPI